MGITHLLMKDKFSNPIKDQVNKVNSINHHHINQLTKLKKLNKMKTNNTNTAQWENELQALKNALISFNLKGFEVWPNHNGFRSKTTFLLRDDSGTSITGSWNYDRLNHFILGYGKALKKEVPPTTPAKQWFYSLSEEEKTRLCQKHFAGIPVSSLMDKSIEAMYMYEHEKESEKEVSVIALEWWNKLPYIGKPYELPSKQRLTSKYFTKITDFLTTDDIVHIYKSEHPTESAPEKEVTGELISTHNSAMLAAMEFGYRECEKGNNLDMAFINFNKALQNK